MLSDRIEQATVEERPKLVALRDKLLKLIDEVDQARKAQAAAERRAREATTEELLGHAESLLGIRHHLHSVHQSIYRKP